MASKWAKLAGEQGEAVVSGRWSRLAKIGRLGVSVSAATMAGGLARRLMPGSGDAKSLRASLLRSRQAEKVIDVLGQLKGASMKVGQILSTDPDLVPPEFSDLLSTLQRDAPPMTYTTVRAELEAAWDRRIEDVLATFDPEPVGAASIGQVHRGTLHDGRDVAIKVQYPGVVASLESDLKNLASLMKLARAVVDKERLDAYLDEVRTAVLEEADYQLEARNLTSFGARLAERDGVRAPAAVPEWTRANVLVMDFIAGDKLDEALAAMEDGPERQATLERWVGLYHWMIHEAHVVHADPHPGNFLLHPSGDLVVLDFGCLKELPEAFADGMLDVMDACWQRDQPRAARTYERMGFGKGGAKVSGFDPDLLREFHRIIMAPFVHDTDFDFGAWKMHEANQRFLLRHPSFLRLVPPADALMTLRVLTGIKGLLTKLGASMNVHQMVLETARKRGRLTGPPRYDADGIAL